MEEQRVIQVNIQLPISELGRLSTLLERFQQVLSSSGQAENASSAGDPSVREVPSTERGENTVFDLARFSVLNGKSGLQEFSGQAQAEPGQIPTSSIPVQTELPQAVSLQVEAEADTSLPASAGRGIEGQPPEAAGTKAPAAQEAGWEEEQDWEAAPGRVPAPSAVQIARNSVTAPLSAGLTVEGGTGTPDPGKKAVLEEQLTAAGPSPLTAEAVSLAFRRDDRRYDNGFPLY